MNNSKLQSAISAFVKNKKANAAYYDDNWTERNERKAYYQSFTKDKLLAMIHVGLPAEARLLVGRERGAVEEKVGELRHVLRALREGRGETRRLSRRLHPRRAIGAPSKRRSRVFDTCGGIG